MRQDRSHAGDAAGIGDAGDSGAPAGAPATARASRPAGGLDAGLGPAAAGMGKVAAAMPPSWESKTITTPARSDAAWDNSGNAFLNIDFAYVSLPPWAELSPAADGCTQIIFTFFPRRGSQSPGNVEVSSRVCRKGGGAEFSKLETLSVLLAVEVGKSSSELRIQPLEIPEICTCTQGPRVSRI